MVEKKIIEEKKERMDMEEWKNMLRKRRIGKDMKERKEVGEEEKGKGETR